MPATGPMQFKKATRARARLRLALVGPSGSGKTMTGLRIACAIAKARGGRLAVIDTERGSASKYVDAARGLDFDTLELGWFSPAEYVHALAAAAKAGYPAVLIDSLSHAWMGKGGALEMVDVAAKKSKSGSSFNAWREVTPEHNMLVDALIQYPGDLIATIRAKTEYVLEEGGNGKKGTPRKVGMAPVQRDGLEYEFDVVADLDLEHNFVPSKSRCSAIVDRVWRRAGEEVAAELLRWLDDGGEPAGDASPIDAHLRAVPSPAAVPPREAAADLGLLKRIEGATSEDDLRALAAELASAPDATKAPLRAAWARRRDTLRAQNSLGTTQPPGPFRETEFPVDRGPPPPSFDDVNDQLKALPGFGGEGEEGKAARKRWWVGTLGYRDVDAKWSQWHAFDRAEASLRFAALAAVEQLAAGVHDTGPLPDYMTNAPERDPGQEG